MWCYSNIPFYYLVISKMEQRGCMKKETMTQEEEDRNAHVIRKADGTVIPLEKSIKVGTKDAPKLVPDPKKAKVTKTVLFSWPVKK